MNTGLPVKAHPCLSDLLVLFLLRKFYKSKLPVFFMVRNFKSTYFSYCKFVGQNCLLKTCQGVKGFTQISPNLVQFVAALSAHSFCHHWSLVCGKYIQGCYRKPTLCVSVLSYYCSKNHQSCVPRVILDMNNTLLLWLMKQEMNLQLQPKTQAILKFHRNELLLLLLDEDNDDDSIITDFELYNSNSHLPGTLKIL